MSRVETQQARLNRLSYAKGVNWQVLVDLAARVPHHRTKTRRGILVRFR